MMRSSSRPSVYVLNEGTIERGLLSMCCTHVRMCCTHTRARAHARTHARTHRHTHDEVVTHTHKHNTHT